MNRERFFAQLPAKLKQSELQKIINAYWLSKNTHRLQSRDQGERYFEHPKRVAYELIRRGFTDADLISAALMHDALEDTHIPASIIELTLGKRVLDFVLELSKVIPHPAPRTGLHDSYEKKPLEEYYLYISKAPIEVRLIKLADRVDNLRSMHDAGWSPERKKRYLAQSVRFVLPIAEATDEKFHSQLRRLIRKESRLLN